MDRLLLTTSEAAAALGVSRDTVLRLVRTGSLRAVDVGTGDRERLRLQPDDLRAFIESRTLPVDGGAP